jgi:hypothetical protein
MPHGPQRHSYFKLQGYHTLNISYYAAATVESGGVVLLKKKDFSPHVFQWRIGLGITN